MADNTNYSYVDDEGLNVEVSGNIHITQVGEKKWIFTTGPRTTVQRYGDAPAVHDGAFFQGGEFKFVQHGKHKHDVAVVEDLACEEGKTVWGKDYVKTKDGCEGPTVESLRSPKKYKQYMRLTGHRERESGEVDSLRERRRRGEKRRDPRIRAEIERLMGDKS